MSQPTIEPARNPATLPARSATVVGGGIGGLTTAIALRRLGLTVRVVEQAPTPGEVGAGLTLWPNALAALRRLDLAAAVIAAGTPLLHGTIRDPRARVLSRSSPAELARTLGEPTVGIHRATLHSLLLANLGDVEVVAGARCTGYRDSGEAVVVCLADGRELDADLLVGADGIRSAIRAQLLPAAQPVYAGYTAWRGVATSATAVAPGEAVETWGRGRRFGYLRLDGERVYWYATENAPAGTLVEPERRRAHLLARFGSWHAPIEELLTATPETAVLQHDLHDLDPLPRFVAGRVALLGDAAHATTPNLGQGACMAIESALALADALAAHPTSLAAALARYERVRRPRTAWVTRTSRRLGTIGQAEGALACALRDLALRLTPDRASRRTLLRAASG